MESKLRDDFLDSLCVTELEIILKALKNNVKYLIHQLKKQLTIYEEAKNDNMYYGHFGDCGEHYYNKYIVEKTKFEFLLSEKIKSEKYYKKARHILKEKCEI